MSEIYKVVVETDHKASAEKVMELFATYKPQFTNFLSGQLRAAKVPADPYMEISKDDFIVRIQTVARDKGIVMAVADKSGTPGFFPYTEVAEGTHYCILENNVLALYTKNNETTPDTRHGNFFTLEDMYAELKNSKQLIAEAEAKQVEVEDQPEEPVHMEVSKR